MSSTPRQEVGRQAEQLAAGYLEERGLKLLLANHRCRLGEIDLVMQEGDTLVIVEVRRRSSRDYGGAAASITRAKQRRIVNATRHLIAMRPPLGRLPIRFDVVTVEPEAGRTKVEWMRSAFRC